MLKEIIEHIGLNYTPVIRKGEELIWVRDGNGMDTECMLEELNDYFLKDINRSQLVSFGNYLLSQERNSMYRDELQTEGMLQERLSKVNHADVENWIESLQNKQ